MKPTIEFDNERELKKFLRKKPLIQIKKLPKIKNPFNPLVGASILVLLLITSLIVVYNVGKDIGHKEAYVHGYDMGFKVAEKYSYENMTLKEVATQNIKTNLSSYISWFGLIVGIAWIIHGVGFKVAG